MEIKDIKDSVLTINNRNSRITTKFFDHSFRDKGCPVNSTQYDLLRLMASNPGLSMSDLGETLGLDRSTISRRLPPLFKAGYIRYKLERMDSRVTIPEVTKEGLALLVKYSGLYIDTDKKAVDKITFN